MKNVLVTGAGGFLGRQLVHELARRGVGVRAVLRSAANAPQFAQGVSANPVGDLAALTRWDDLLRDVDCVFHLAARAHVLTDAGGKNADAYRINNELVTARLASAAAAAGVSRFVFVSSIKVFGEADRGRSFTAEDEPRPEDPYGVSKLQAERAIIEACGGSRMSAAIVRPPLIYGPGVRANFLRLMRWVHRGVPLPLGAIDNRRSLVSSYNLVDFLCRCATHDLAGVATLLVSDGSDISTPQLIRLLADAMGRKPRLLPAPPALLRLAGRLTGRSDEFDRLLGSLTLDIAASSRRLAWSPLVSLHEGIRRTVADYLSSAQRP
jgi:nucleoside-diphosphate-sugar epimerase